MRPMLGKVFVIEEEMVVISKSVEERRKCYNLVGVL